MDMYFMSIIVALLVAIIFELIAFFIMLRPPLTSFETFLWLLTIIGLNCVTIPIAQLIYSYLINLGTLTSWFITELIIIFFEGFFINKIMRINFKKAALYSIVLNITSIISGEILCWLEFLPWCF